MAQKMKTLTPRTSKRKTVNIDCKKQKNKNKEPKAEWLLHHSREENDEGGVVMFGKSDSSPQGL